MQPKQALTIGEITKWSVVATTLLLTPFLIFHIIHSKIALTLFFTSIALDFIANRHWENIRWKPTNYVFIAMIAYYLLLWIWHPFEQYHIGLFHHDAESMLPFIAFGIIGLVYKFPEQLKFHYIAIPMNITALVCTIYCIVRLLQLPDLASDLNTIQWQFSYIREQYVNLHMTFNLYINITILLNLYCIYNTNNKWLKMIFALSSALLITVILLSEGRTGFITIITLILLYIGIQTYYYKRWLVIPYFFLGIASFVIIFSMHTRSGNLTGNPRLYIWENSFEVIKERPIIGYGVNDGRVAFVEHGINTPEFVDNYLSKARGIDTTKTKDLYKTHPHNVFIDAWISFGIIGLIIHLLIYLLPTLITKKQKRLYVFALTVIFGMQAMFETYTYGVPPMLFGLMLTLFLQLPDDDLLLDSSKARLSGWSIKKCS